MARLPLNKATLTRKKRDLATYQQFLPSLDLKRKMLLAEERRLRAEAAAAARHETEIREGAGAALPMLANSHVRVEDLVEVSSVDMAEASVAGVHVPVLCGVQFSVKPYGLMSRPHWADRVVERWQAAVRATIERRVAELRLRRIAEARAVVTQRVNLFDKVLVPRTRAEIARIEIALQDAERVQVIRAKVAKSKARARAGGPA